MSPTAGPSDDRGGLGFIVRVLTKDAGGSWLFLGTASLVDNRHALTCQHVIAARDPFGEPMDVARPDLQVMAADGQSLPATALFMDAARDLALLALDSPIAVAPPTFLFGLRRASEPHLRSLFIAAFGYCDGRHDAELWHHEVGKLILLASYRQDGDSMAQLQLSGGLPAGTSGGPVLVRRRNHWYVAGMVFLGGERSATSRLIMADEILAFLDAAGIRPTERADTAKVLKSGLSGIIRDGMLQRRPWAALGMSAAVVILAAALAIRPLSEGDVRPIGREMVTDFALPLPDEPSLAVIPFETLTDDPAQRHISTGITDSLVSALSKLSGLFVIANDAVAAYQDDQPNAAAIARDFGVRYILKGSLQRSGERLRVHAQLIDMVSGKSLWAESHDGAIHELFELQDRVTLGVVRALDIEMTIPERARLSETETSNTMAYQLFAEGHELLSQESPKALAAAVDAFDRAVALDPGYGRAHAALVQAYWESAANGRYRELGVNSAADARIEAGIRLAPALQHSTALAHLLASDMHLVNRRFAKALHDAEQALALDPNDPDAHIAMARTLIFSGRPEEALPHIERAMRLNPRIAVTVSNTAVQATTSAPADYLVTLGLARFGMARFRSAATLFERAIAQEPDAIAAAAPLAAAYAHLGESERARQALDRMIEAKLASLGRRPTLADEQQAWPYKNGDDTSRLVDGLRLAGFG